MKCRERVKILNLIVTKLLQSQLKRYHSRYTTILSGFIYFLLSIDYTEVMRDKDLIIDS